VTVEGSWEPLANVTIARVWRGQTAIPSAEAVVQTQVRKSGRIAFPRITGEAGSTLKMLVTKKDGTSTFHDVVVAPEQRTTPRLELSLGADGIVAGPGWTVTMIDGPWNGDVATGMPAPKRFADLVDRLHWHGGQEVHLDEDGNSRVVLVLRAGRDVSWRMVQWVMMAAADPRVRIHRLTFASSSGRDEARQQIDLPIDEGLSAQPRIQIPVTLVRTRAGGPLEISHGSPDGPTETLPWEALPERLQATRMSFGDTGPQLVGLIRVPPPGLITHAEVTRVLTAFREAGIEDIRFEGAPLR